MKLSEHFTTEEFEASETAAELHIENLMSDAEIIRAQLLCEATLEPIRAIVKKPIVITSGFRCHELNEAVNGEETSQHTKGEAVDFHVPGIPCEDVFVMIKDKVNYDQLILELRAEKEWIHVSYRPHPRHQFMRIVI